MPDTIEIKVALAPGVPSRIAFFNQFGIHKSGTLVELHFSFGRSESDSFGGLIVVVPADQIDAQKPSFLRYLKDIDLPQEPVAGKVRVRDPKDVVFADFVGLARNVGMGEIAFHALSWKSAIDRRSGKGEKADKKDSPPVLADCVALLRSEVDIHRNWISLLYAQPD